MCAAAGLSICSLGEREVLGGSAAWRPDAGLRGCVMGWALSVTTRYQTVLCAE
jgi:hypothetical protein